MDKKRGNDESMIGKSDRTHGFLRTLKPQKLSSKFINMFFFLKYIEILRTLKHQA